MSAASNPSPTPAPAPTGPAMPIPGRRGVGIWKMGGSLLAIAGLAAALHWSWPGRGGPPTASASTSFLATAAQGRLEVRLRVAGNTVAQDYVSVRAPMQRGWDRMDMTLQYLAPSGSWVKRGDVVAQIENQFLRDRMDDNMASLDQADLDLKKLIAQQGVDLENLRQSLRQAKAALDKAELDFRTAEVRTEIDRELLKLAVEEARARYQELQKDLANQELVRKAALRIQEINRTQIRERLERQKQDLERFTIRAPIDGLVVTETIWRRGEPQQIREGDQVGSGMPILKIVNTASMLLEGMVNQVESSSLRIGQPAEVTIDAFPELKFRGKVYSIGALGVGSRMQNDYVRNIPVRIKIEGSDPRLIPDLSAAADIIIEQSEVATLVPRSAIRIEEGRPHVYVKAGDRFERRPVEVGLQNPTQAAVITGVKPGEQVRLHN